MNRSIFSWLPLIVWVVLFYFIATYHIASTHYNFFLFILILSSFFIVGIYLLFFKKSWGVQNKPRN